MPPKLRHARVVMLGTSLAFGMALLSVLILITLAGGFGPSRVMFIVLLGVLVGGVLAFVLGMGWWIAGGGPEWARSRPPRRVDVVPRPGWVLVAVLLTLGALFAAVGFLGTAIAAFELGGHPAEAAALAGETYRPCGSRNGRGCDPDYLASFRLPDGEVRESELAAADGAPKPGTEILYDPRDPSRAMLRSDWSSGYFGTDFLLGTGGLLATVGIPWVGTLLARRRGARLRALLTQGVIREMDFVPPKGRNLSRWRVTFDGGALATYGDSSLFREAVGDRWPPGTRPALAPSK